MESEHTTDKFLTELLAMANRDTIDFSSQFIQCDVIYVGNLQAHTVEVHGIQELPPLRLACMTGLEILDATVYNKSNL